MCIMCLIYVQCLNNSPEVYSNPRGTFIKDVKISR